VYEEAAAWVTQLEGRAPAADERARFDDWIGRSPTHASAYEEALRTWRDLWSLEPRWSMACDNMLRQLVR